MSDVVKKMPFDFILETDGGGYWTAKAKSVKTTEIELEYNDEPYRNDGKLYGELRVYFDTNTWDVQFDGLIYTDKQFLDDLRGCLDVTGLEDADVTYSEQGMQGDTYVSLDVGDEFINSWTFKDWADSELVGL